MFSSYILLHQPLTEKSVLIKNMVKLVIGHRVGNAVTDGAAGHIQSLDAPVQQPDKLKPADTGILTGILSKALSLAQIVRSGTIVRLQNINDEAHLILPDNQKIGIHRLLLRVLLIGNAQRPRLSRRITEPADIVRTATLGLKDSLFPIVQVDDRLAGRIVHKQMVGISLADITALDADGLRQPEVMLTDDVAIRNNAVILFPIPLSQARDTTAIRVVDVVEPAAGIVVEHIHAVCVGGKDDDVNFCIPAGLSSSAYRVP